MIVNIRRQSSFKDFDESCGENEGCTSGESSCEVGKRSILFSWTTCIWSIRAYCSLDRIKSEEVGFRVEMGPDPGILLIRGWPCFAQGTFDPNGKN